MPDPQYNTSVETMTPGSAVADGLQQILAQRRADAQQALMNKMNQDKFGLEQQNIQSEIASRADTNATNKTIRDAQAAATNQTVLDKQAKQARFKASSDWFRNNYIGTDDYNKLPAEAKAVWNLALTDPDTMEKLVASKMTPQAKEEDSAPMWTVSRLNGKVTPMLDPAGKQIMGKKGERPVEWGVEPPQPNAANVPTTYFNDEPDPSDPTKTIKVPYALTPQEYASIGFSDPTKRVKGVVAGGNVHRGNLPVAPSVKPTKISDQTWREFLAAKQSADKDPSNVNSQSIRDNVVKKVVTEYPASPDVKEFVNSTWMKPVARAMQPAQIISGMRPAPSKEEAQQITELWGLLSGK